MFGSIYKITNRLTGQIYIGQTKKSLDQRFKAHEYTAKYLAYGHNEMHQDIRRFGIEAFQIYLVCRANNQLELDLREAFCIRIFKSHAPVNYNIKSAAKGPKTISIETRKKMSLSALGKTRKPHTRETKEKIAASNRGKKRSEQTKQRLRLSHLGKPATQNRKAIAVYKDGILLKKYPSITLAAKDLGVCRTAIGNVLTGLNKTFNKMTAVYIG